LKRSAGVVVAALTVFAFVAASGPAGADVSGSNGRIVFGRTDFAVDESFTYTTNPDGSHVQPLFPDFQSESPHWSPDGNEVAVISLLGATCPPSCVGSTVIINPDNGSYRVLAPQGLPAVATACSLWSPDATYFACEGSNDSEPTVNGIYTIRSSDGGGLTRITDAEGATDIPIDYSPDGKQIVFGRVGPDHACTPTSALFVVNVDGSELRRITPWGFCDDDGNWSPDGTEIGFEHRGSLFVVHPDGTGLAKVPLAIGGGSGAGDFGWSPDGNRIVFLLFARTGPRSFQEGIATANADGSDVRQVTSSPSFDHGPDWGTHPLAT
jgi:Tol biopolymer transport system component